MVKDVMNVLEYTWPIVAVSIVSLISIRIAYVIKYKNKFILYEELLKLIFVIYVLIFFQVVTYQDVISYGNNFIPFKELTRYSIGSSLFYKNVVGNILLFMPYGFFVSYFLRLEKSDKWLTFNLILLASLSIECVQLVIGRCFDVDDILLNLVGGMIGYFVYRFLELVTDKMSKRTISTILTSIIIILIVILLYIMMWGIMKLGLFNETEENVDEFFKVIKKVLKKGLEILDIHDVEFNIIVVDNNYIHELNKTYRKIDRATDVISFALEDDKTFTLKKRVLGDIYISIDKVYEQAKEYGHSALREICFLAVHGMLHLLGYDHMTESEEKEMFALQEKILESSNILR